MRVLHVSPSYRPAWIYGGPTLSVSRLCESQVEAGAEVQVYTTTANGKDELQITSNVCHEVNAVKVIYFSRLTGDHSHFSPRLLLRLLRNVHRYDVVHIHSWWNLVSVLSVFICQIRGIRPVLSPRGMISPYGKFSGRSTIKRIFQLILGRYLLKNTILHATSSREVLQARQVLTEWPFFIAPNIVDLTAQEYSENGTEVQSSGTFRLIFLSRMHEVKGLDILFHALKNLKFPWHLYLIGNGKDKYIRELKELARSLGIEGRTEWCGWVNGDEKFRLLSTADMLVLSSRSENFSNVVLEALSVGIPVAISDQVGMSEYIIESDLGWVFPLSNEEWSKGLEDIYYDIEKRARIKQEARQKVRSDFNNVTVAKKYLSAYQTYRKKS